MSFDSDNNEASLQEQQIAALEQLFSPDGKGGKRESGLTLRDFALHLERNSIPIPGRRGTKPGAFYAHFNRITEGKCHPVHLEATVELIADFFYQKNELEVAKDLRKLISNQDGEGENRVCIQGNELLRYVAKPEENPSLVDDWHFSTMHGESDLYRASTVVFIAEHLPSLDIVKSPLPILDLAIAMSRVAITYGDYSVTRRICEALLKPYGVYRTPKINLVHFFDADRLRVEAESFVEGPDQVKKFMNDYKIVINRLDLCANLSLGEMNTLVLRRDDVLLRTMARLVFASAVPYSETDPTVLAKARFHLKIADAFDRFKGSLFKASQDAAFDVASVKPLHPKEDAELPFIFYDTYVRALAIVKNSYVDAIELYDSLNLRVYHDDVEFKKMGRRHGKSPHVNKVKQYRMRTTEAMIGCWAVHQMLASATKDKPADFVRIIELLELSKVSTLKLLETANSDSMQHARNLVGLISIFMAPLDSRLKRILKAAGAKSNT
jgi:hypothetical protein